MFDVMVEGRVFPLDVQKFVDLELEDGSSLIYHVKAIPTVGYSLGFGSS